jgi:hypothetical protein
LAGTENNIQKNAIPQLMTATVNNGVWWNLKGPCLANVMKILEMVSSTIVVMPTILPHAALHFLASKIQRN